MAIDTLSTESRLTTQRCTMGSSPGSSTTSLGRPRIVVVHGATSTRRSREIAASRNKTTTGRRAMSGGSHHQSSPRLGPDITLLAPLHEMQRDPPRHPAPATGAGRMPHTPRRSRWPDGSQAEPPAPRPWSDFGKRRSSSRRCRYRTELSNRRAQAGRRRPQRARGDRSTRDNGSHLDRGTSAGAVRNFRRMHRPWTANRSAESRLPTAHRSDPASTGVAHRDRRRTVDRPELGGVASTAGLRAFDLGDASVGLAAGSVEQVSRDQRRIGDETTPYYGIAFVRGQRLELGCRPDVIVCHAHTVPEGCDISRRSWCPREVREGGLEPPHPYGRRHLKPVRLPFPPLARSVVRLARRRRNGPSRFGS